MRLTLHFLARTTYVLITLSLLLIFSAFSQAEELQFQHLSVNEGLSQSTVFCIVQDDKGLIWIGTENGLNRYDGYQFTVYKNDSNNPNSLSSNYIWDLQKGEEGILWVGTDNGLNRFDMVRQTIKRYLHDDNNPNSLTHNDVRSLYQDRQGFIWIGTMSGWNRFDPKTETFTRYHHQEGDPTSISHNQVKWNKTIYEDRHGDVWIGTAGGGLNKFDPKTGTFTHFHHQPTNPHSLNNEDINIIYEDRAGTLWIGGLAGLDKFDPITQTATHYFQESVVNDIFQDKAGLLWITTDTTGLYHFNPKTEQYDQYQYDSYNKTGLSNSILTTLYEDRSGTLWIGTWGGGVNRFDPMVKPFGLYDYQLYNAKGLSAPGIFGAVEDADQRTLWIGTEGGGLNRLNRLTGIFTHYRHDENNLNSILHDIVYAVVQDSQKRLWIGTWGGLSYLDPVKKKVINFPHNDKDDNSLSGNEIYTMIQDRHGDLWIGTWYSGLNHFNPKTRTFTRYQHDESKPDSLGDNLILTIYEDRQGTLWVGTGAGGVNRFHPDTGKFTRYLHNDKIQHSLSYNYITAIYEDRQGRFWIGTNGGGLNEMDRTTGQFRVYRQSDGLADDIIYKIVEDQQGYLWLATMNGLSRFDPQTRQFRNYTVEDGLQGKEFFTGMALSSGELFFGGRNSFNLFRPELIKDNPFIPPIVFTDFKLFDQSVPLGPLLTKNIVFTDNITLSHQDTVFSFEFAALNYLSPQQNRYAYYMEGFDKEWIKVDSQRRLVTYTNLDAGQYTFRVKGSNNDGIWNETGTAIKLTILPPWWKTWWAYLAYFIVTVGSAIALFTAQQRKLARTRAINERLRQVDKLKDEFLANTSHELRTPLNGIIGLTESLLEGAAGPLSEKMQTNLAMIISSSKRLATLVNDILDFSKLKHKTIELQLKPICLRGIVDIILFLSQPLVAKKSLQLMNTVANDLPPVEADENRLQQILHNLIGNAIKFTEHGQIEVSAQVHQKRVQVTVTDSGIGISEEQQGRIFESFEQADGSTAREYGGTGLGLAVTKKLVELHGGTLTVTSQVGIGSKFTFTLPISSGQPSSTVTVSQLSKLSTLDILDPEVTTDLPNESESKELCCILAVDDEPVNLQVLNNFLSLKAHCRIVQATSGMEAIQLIKEGLHPDIILLDVMMPKMSGYEVTQKIRETWTLSELPILLLTAKNRVEDLVTGLSVGANDYVTKPFSKDELIARINTQLNIKRLKEENMRMQTELEISRHLQQVLLPRPHELAQIQGLEVAGFMEPAAEVGGDYYDVLVHEKGVKIGIGDVTGHGLESGILAMMVQTAVRTLLTHGETNAIKFLATINRTIYDNVQRMGIDRNLTLCLLDWQENQLRMSGQHEEVLIIRQGTIEIIDTMDLGFTVGLEPDITPFVADHSITLNAGDVVILYTDGVTEAENTAGELYGNERLQAIACQHWQNSVVEIKKAIVANVRQFIGKKLLLDDVTLVVLKQKG